MSEEREEEIRGKERIRKQKKAEKLKEVENKEDRIQQLEKQKKYMKDYQEIIIRKIIWKNI